MDLENSFLLFKMWAIHSDSFQRIQYGKEKDQLNSGET
jgi:hypothetical protein